MNTKELIKAAGARFKHSESKLRLHEKYSARLVIAHSGGMWRITPELLGFLQNCSGEAVLLDVYDTPVKINAPELYKIASALYSRVTDEWYEEYTTLNKNR